jgi:hypothetical protein
MGVSLEGKDGFEFPNNFNIYLQLRGFPAKIFSSISQHRMNKQWLNDCKSTSIQMR